MARQASASGGHASREPAPQLPDAKKIRVNGGRCIIEYVDVAPTAPAASPATFVLVHGAPGSLQDFRYLVPLLSKEARVLAVNVPGFGASTTVNSSEYYSQIAAEPATIAVAEVLAVLCKHDTNVFIVGHSFGGHTAISLARLALGETHPCHVKGLALLASAGYRPHQTLVPRTASVLTAIIKAEIPLISWVTAEVTRWIMTTFVGFPRQQPMNYYISGLYRQTTTDYDRVMHDLATLSAVPTFCAWSKNDFHIEEEISLILNEAAKGPGPRFAFERGGHNIQKTRAPFLAEELLKWVDDVTAGRCSSTDNTPRVLE